MAGIGPSLLPLFLLFQHEVGRREREADKVLHFLGKGRILSVSTSLTSVADKKMSAWHVSNTGSLLLDSRCVFSRKSYGGLITLIFLK